MSRSYDAGVSVVLRWCSGHVVRVFRSCLWWCPGRVVIVSRSSWSCCDGALRRFHAHNNGAPHTNSQAQRHPATALTAVPAAGPTPTLQCARGHTSCSLAACIHRKKMSKGDSNHNITESPSGTSLEIFSKFNGFGRHETSKVQRNFVANVPNSVKISGK